MSKPDDKPRNLESDVPHIDVLIAQQYAEQREAEELISGFDRPARTPKRRQPSDFVDYHSRGERREPRKTESLAKKERPTQPIPRRPRVPPWLSWVGVALVMVLVGLSTAILTSGGAARRAAAPVTSASVMTTITSATTPPPSSTAVLVVPPPLTPERVDEPVPTPRPSTSRSPESPATTTMPIVTAEPARDLARPPPRTDFIRDL